MSFFKNFYSRSQVAPTPHRVDASSIRPYYLLAVLILVMLAAGSFLSLRQFTSAQRNATNLINTSRFQRTLSQRIALLAIQLVSETDTANRAPIRDELRGLIDQMLIAHEGLTSGSLDGRFQYELSPEIRALYFEEPTLLDQQVRDYLAQADQLVSKPDAELSPADTAVLTRTAPILLIDLDAAAVQYQLEDTSYVEQLEQQELLSFFVSLGVLILITVFIFYPMENRIRREQTMLLMEIDMRREAERMLLESEALYRLIAHNLPDSAVMLYDQDLRYLLAEGPVLEEAGYSKLKLEGRTVQEALPKASAEVFVPIYQAALQGQESDFERTSADDKVYHIRVVPVREDQNRVIGGLIVVQDITLRKQAEAALKESEERFRQIADTVRSVFWMIDPATGQIIYISPAYEKIWGRSSRDYYEIGLSMSQDIHPEDRERVANERKTKAQTGDYNVEYRIIRPDGQTRWINSTSYPITDDDGRLTRVIGISEDVTERKELQAAAFERERVQLLSDFIRDTSHDLRTPLTVMGTSLYLLRKLTDPEQRASRIDLIEQQISRLNGLITDLHTMANLDVITSIEKMRLDINRLATDIYTEYSQKTQSKMIQLDLQPDLPLIRAHEPTLKHALVNLMNNAIEYTGDGGTITIRTKAAEESLVISVEDDGIGIAEEHLDQIFERLYKVDDARSTRSGPGLGLAMVKRLMELHGGNVEVESTVGKGSIFRLCIPMEVEETVGV